MNKNKEKITNAEQLYKESEIVLHSKWLAGAFEVGRGMGFLHYLRNGKTYTYPYIQMADNVEDRVRYNLRFGGRVKPTKGASFNWRCEGRDVIPVAESIERFTLARKDTVKAIIDWGNTDSREERADIGGKIKAGSRTEVAKEDYSGFVNDPEILAGILDERGVVYTRENRKPGSIFPHFTLVSTNRPLLDALAENYKGIVYDYKVNDEDSSPMRFGWESHDKEVIRGIYSHAREHIKFRTRIDPQLQSIILDR